MTGWTSREQKRVYQREWYARRRADWFAGQVCLVCGTTENLRLDRVDPTQKVSHRIWSWSAKRRTAELAKCQVLCHTHHAEKTLRNGEHARGTELPHTKLTEAQVLEMRALRAQGWTYTAIGERYALSRCVARSTIVRNWRHVPG